MSRQELKQTLEEYHLGSLLPLACSVCYPIAPRTPYSGVVSIPRGLEALPHQSLIKKMHLHYRVAGRQSGGGLFLKVLIPK